jgi:hypothetical protein
MTILTYIMLGFFVLISVLDIKYRKIPSIILTSFIFVPLAIHPLGLFTGVLAGLLGLLLWELGYFEGIADIKATIIIGVMLSSMAFFPFFMIFLVTIGLIYVLIWRFLLKSEGEIPFIPVFLLVYLALFSLGGLA